jgi:hypothetical protein
VIDGILYRDQFADRSHYSLQKIECLLASAGNKDVIIRSGFRFPAGLFQKILPQRSVPGG